MLPAELLEAIIKYVKSNKDLKSLCLANKQCYFFARKQLWKELKLRLFISEELNLLITMPIQVLDISNLKAWHMSGNGFLFKLIKQMMRLKHLKLDSSLVITDDESWSTMLNHCKINTVTIYCEWSISLDYLIVFCKTHLSNFKYLTSLNIDDEEYLYDGIIKCEFYEPLQSGFSKLKKLYIEVGNLESYLFERFFKKLDYFTGVHLLKLNFTEA